MNVINLYEGFTDAEVKTIPSNISTKIVQRWQTKSDEFGKLKAEYESFKIDNGELLIWLMIALNISNLSVGGRVGPKPITDHHLHSVQLGWPLSDIFQRGLSSSKLGCRDRRYLDISSSKEPFKIGINSRFLSEILTILTPSHQPYRGASP